MADDYADHSGGLSSPAQGAFLVTPGATELTHATRGIAFSAAGTLKITTLEGETLEIPPDTLAAGVIHPIRATHILASSGTDPTDIVGFY